MRKPSTRHPIASREEWLRARTDLLKAEKELTRRGDEVAKQRRELPWVRIDKEYHFETEDGKVLLADLFKGRSQLLIYHFMFGPDYTAGCPSCSAIADGFNGFAIHLANHDVMLWAVSRAPFPKLQAYRRRMGWTFPWASSFNSEFNCDFNVQVTEKQQREGGAEYNYRREAASQATWSSKYGDEGPLAEFAARCGTDPATYIRERPGMSAFALEAGVVYHTYSTYARGLDGLWGMYQWLDRAPKGRSEETGIWWRRPKATTTTSKSETTRHGRMKSLFFLLPLCLGCALQAANTPTLKLLQTIPLPSVKGRFDHFATDTKGQRLFVAALGNNTLEVIDLAAGKRLHSLPGMAKPTGVLYLPELNQVIVANGDDGTLKVLSGADFKVLRNLTSLNDADNLRLDPQTKLAWLGYGDGALAIIDPAAAKLSGSVKLPAHPESFQLEKSDRRIFVNVPDAKQVAVIDRVKRTVTDTWPMQTFQANFPMALDQTNHRLFIGCRQPARLVVLDTATGKPVTDLAISGDTDDLFYDAARKRLYISCGEGFIDTIEQTTPDTYKSISRLPTAPGARTGFFSTDLDRFYLAVPARRTQKAEIRVYQPQ